MLLSFPVSPGFVGCRPGPAWMSIISRVALPLPPPCSVSLSARILQRLRMEPLKCYETGIGNPFLSSCQAVEGACGVWRHWKGECNVSAGVMTQLVRCLQLCAHHSSGSHMEGRWARRGGTEAAMGRACGSQQQPGDSC